MTIDEVLDRLEGVEKVGSGWKAKCPCHDDSSPSLSISEGDDGTPLWFCHAGCSQEAVGAILSPSGGKSDPEAVYDYTDESGALLYQVLRFEP